MCTGKIGKRDALGCDHGVRPSFRGSDDLRCSFKTITQALLVKVTR